MEISKDLIRYDRRVRPSRGRALDSAHGEAKSELVCLLESVHTRNTKDDAFFGVSVYSNQDVARVLGICMRDASSPRVVSQCIISHLFPFHKRESFCAVLDVDVNLSAFMIKSISSR